MTVMTIQSSIVGVFLAAKRVNSGVKPEKLQGTDRRAICQKTVRATRAKEVRLEKPAEKHPSPGHTHVGFGARSVPKLLGGGYGVFTPKLRQENAQWFKLP